LPNVAVHDIAIHPRDNDLVIATHGRGIWIVDNITPLRALTPEVLQKDVVFMQTAPVVQLIPAQGGWANGDAAFEGANPPNAADRQAQWDLANKLYAQLAEMSVAVDRINSVRTALDDRASKLPAADALTKRLRIASSDVDTLRRKIVATKEGGMITGEERLRE